MTANKFYRKRLLELTPEGITKRINKIVCIDKEVQICEDYHEYKVKKLNLDGVMFCNCNIQNDTTWDKGFYQCNKCKGLIRVIEH